ncbi:ADP-ribosylglycohydrolase family protein [Streptomyces sp. NPDC060005]|uniref:ADP-ribosylglycohydrolase family protein n=1 Tax=Streptomyces sp. NPDC060005 TaxID=3347034 RepID=UPI00369E2698
MTAIGTILGSAVGDALGAPFEFGPEGAFTRRFPVPGRGGEMCGGGGWDPGEATDDTQMAVVLGESLVRHGGLELPDVFDGFRQWAAVEPKDIGLQTEAVLTSGDPWDLASALHFQVSQRAAGNGSLMRAATSAVFFASCGRDVTMSAARRIASLTHGDPAAWEGTAILHELIRTALVGHDPLTALPDTLDGDEAVPARWTEVLHVPLPGSGGRVLRADGLAGLAGRLADGPRTPVEGITTP